MNVPLQKGGRGYWKTRGTGELVSVLHMHRAKSVESVVFIVIHILHAGIFLLDADMKSVLLSHSPVTIQSMWVLTWVCSPSGYLSSPQHLLLDLSPSGYPSLAAEMVPADDNSMS
jgi:hypothetical protein